MGEVEVLQDLAELSWRAAEAIVRAAVELIREKGRFALALSGGATPATAYRLLAGMGRDAGLDWGAVHLYWADERCVPPDHPESNYRLVRETLLSRAPIPAANVHRVSGEDPDPARAAEAYHHILPERLDLLVLGIGEDGHTASLFPGCPALGERERRAVAVASPKPPPRRITVTPPVIAEAGAILVLAAGVGKAAAVARALEGPVDVARCPAQLARRGRWLLDRAAAAGLAGNGVEPLR